MLSLSPFLWVFHSMLSHVKLRLLLSGLIPGSAPISRVFRQVTLITYSNSELHEVKTPIRGPWSTSLTWEIFPINKHGLLYQHIHFFWEKFIYLTLFTERWFVLSLVGNGPVVLKFKNYVKCVLCHLWKGRRPSFEQIWLSFTHRWFVPRLVVLT